MASYGGDPATSPRRILVAEDDDDMRRLVVETLRKDGHDVVEAADGGRLLVRLARSFGGGDADAFDLVISDVKMPVCSGLQILEQLRASRWSTPMILMTAFGDDAVRSRSRSLGAVLLDKPFDMGDLRGAVARALRPEGDPPAR